MSAISAPKGVPDYLPPRSLDFQFIKEAMLDQARRAGYHYTELPVFESTELFVRGVGESTDVVSKEMYTFLDRGERSITLRPEGTAGVMRAVIEHRLDRGALPVKLSYAGPFFRAERPQHGRYRQLQQMGIEALGSADPIIDAEVIAIADRAFRSLGLQKYRLDLTSLGCSECRPNYRSVLQSFLARCNFDADTKARAEINPLRVLDDKRPEVIEQLADVPVMVNHLCQSCADHFGQVQQYLEIFDVPWTLAPRMVRGLDYYTRTTFEFVHEELGAQSGIGGGGRYDGLMSELGGSDLSGIGFGLGLDRTLLACEAEDLTPFVESSVDIFFIPLGEAAREIAVRLVNELRARGIACDLAFDNRALKGALKMANKLASPHVAIIGEDEVAAHTVTLKTMATGEQQSLEAAAAVIETALTTGRKDTR